MYIKRSNYWRIYSICFLIVSFIIFIPFVLKGNGFILIGDGYNTYYPALCYIGNYLRNLFSGGSGGLQFDFSIGLGESIISTLNFSGFGEVLNILAVCVSEEHMVYLYTFLQIVRLFLAGVSFSIYAFGNNGQPKCVLVGSVIYVFSLFSLTQGIYFATFLFPMITFPLLLRGVEKVVQKEGRLGFSPMLVLGVFLQGLCGYYFLYMETVALIVYFFVYLWTYRSKDFQEKKWSVLFLKIFSFGLHYIIGIMMAGVIFIPSIVGFFNSTRTNTQHIMWKSLFLLPEWKTYLDNISGIFSLNETGFCLGIPILGILSVIWLYEQKKSKHITVCLSIFGVGIFIPLFGYIMNAFSSVGYRWTFMLYFWIAYSVVQTIENIEMLTIRKVIAGIGIVLFTILLNLFIYPWSFELLLRTFYYIFFLAIILFFLFYNKRKEIIKINKEKMHNIIIVILLINVCMNGFLLNAPHVVGGLGNSGGFLSNQEVSPSIEESSVNDLLPSSEFCRYDIYDSALSASLIMNYNSTVSYYSVMNKYVSEFYQEMFISPGVRSASFILKGLDSRQIIESLLSVKYYSTYEIMENGSRKQKIIENQEFLPLGFTYNKSMKRNDFDRLNPLDKAEAMTQAVILDQDIDADNKEWELPKYSSYEIPCVVNMINVGRDENGFEVSGESKIEIQFVPDIGQGELYVDLEGFILQSNGTRDVIVGNKDIQLRNPEDGYYCGTEDFWVKVDGDPNNADEIAICFDQAGRYKLEDIKMYFYPTEGLSGQFSNLRKDSLYNVNFTGDKLMADISVDEDKILFLSIPYSDGWSAIVDGEKTKILKANIAFMAIPLKAGHHSIELEYTTPGIVMGFVFSISGLVIFIVICFCEKICYNPIRKKTKG